MEMKLSEAIRTGAKFRPQTQGEYFADGCSCAIGAAIETVTGVSDKASLMKLGFEFEDVFPVLYQKVHSPINGAEQRVFAVICCLNDSHKWTREQIADWLELIGY